MSDLWPKEIRISPERTKLTLVPISGDNLVFTAEFLRINSPSAEVRGHGAHVPPPVRNKEAVMIIGAEPVGNYAVRLTFDDLHASGLFSWRYLADIHKRQDELWQAYKKRLAQLDTKETL